MRTVVIDRLILLQQFDAATEPLSIKVSSDSFRGAARKANTLRAAVGAEDRRAILRRYRRDGNQTDWDDRE